MEFRYFEHIIEAPHTFEQMRTASVGNIFTPLIASLSENCRRHEIIPALLISKCHFSTCELDEADLNEARAYACEIVAWRIVSHLSETSRIDHLLHQLPFTMPHYADNPVGQLRSHIQSGHQDRLPNIGEDAESAVLLCPRQTDGQAPALVAKALPDPLAELISTLVGLNALEIAAVVDARKFLSQRVVQEVVDDIWNGRIIFWESLSVYTTKMAKTYNKRKADPYCRLRVPKYQKGFEAVFLASFLVLYYIVLLQRNKNLISAVEVLLYIWIAAFAYEEAGEFQDTARSFYTANLWNLWDVGIVGIGFAYMIASESFCDAQLALIYEFVPISIDD